MDVFVGNFQASKLSEQVAVSAEALALAFAKRKILQSDANQNNPAIMPSPG
jgi:hypothetical protein